MTSKGAKLYNKLFTKILDSSVWLEADTTRIIWFTLLAAMDEDGFAPFASVRNLAHRARVQEEAGQLAVDRLESPDPDSSDPENEGRRIERVPGGWMVLNGPKYRDLVTREVIKEKTRLRVAKHRREKRGETECNAPVTPTKRTVTPSGADTKSDSEHEHSSPPIPPRRARQSDEDTLPTTPESKLLADIAHRKHTTPWKSGEIRTYRELRRTGALTEENLGLVFRYSESERLRGEDGAHRRSLETLLNNFSGEIDRATAWEDAQKRPQMNGRRGEERYVPAADAPF